MRLHKTHTKIAMSMIEDLFSWHNSDMVYNVASLLLNYHFNQITDDMIHEACKILRANDMLETSNLAIDLLVYWNRVKSHEV